MNSTEYLDSLFSAGQKKKKHKIVEQDDLKKHPFDNSVERINVDDIVEEMKRELYRMLNISVDENGRIILNDKR